MIGTLGVVVAGGRGSRLGLGTPKALVRVGGVTLLERALATLVKVCDEVVVAAPEALDLPVPPAQRVPDLPEAQGPLSGLVAGLTSRPHRRALALGIDFPLLGSSVLQGLLDRLGDRLAVVPAPFGIPQPLAAAYAGGAAPRLHSRLQAGERSVTIAALSLDPLVLSDPELMLLGPGPDSFLNVNTVSDLENAERRLGAATRVGRG